MTRETPQFGLRMPLELRELIEKEAKINGRSINAEIIARLKSSLDNSATVSNGYSVRELVPEKYRGQELSEIERLLLTVFRRMPVDKQLALVSLFK